MVTILTLLALLNLAGLMLGAWWAAWAAGMLDELVSRGTEQGHLLVSSGDLLSTISQRLDRAPAAELGAFVPSDEDAARLEREHRVASNRFLASQRHLPTSRQDSGRSAMPSGGATSTPGAMSFPVA